jgi:hypothetical protein
VTRFWCNVRLAGNSLTNFASQSRLDVIRLNAPVVGSLINVQISFIDAYLEEEMIENVGVGCWHPSELPIGDAESTRSVEAR